MPPSAASLWDELREHNVFFDSLVDRIPAQLYVTNYVAVDEDAPRSKYHKTSHRDSKDARKNRNKRQKFSTAEPKESTTKVQERLAAEGHDRSARTGTPKSTENTAAASSSSRIEALRAKLHAKLIEKRGQRPTDPNVVSKRAARRAEKRKRREEAIQRNKKKTSAAATTKETKYKVSASVLNDPSRDLETVDFGLTGWNDSKADKLEEYHKTNKSLRNLTKGKNLHKIMADAEAKRQKLEALEKGTPEEQEKASSIQWKDTLQEASGHRVKDDPTKIRKALKRKLVKKVKSQKAWKTRMDQTQQKQKERQSIRNQNLKLRKKGGSVGANLSKQPQNERRLSRPGFEGRKQDFLNKAKD